MWEILQKRRRWDWDWEDWGPLNATKRFISARSHLKAHPGSGLLHPPPGRGGGLTGRGRKYLTDFKKPVKIGNNFHQKNWKNNPKGVGEGIQSLDFHLGPSPSPRGSPTLKRGLNSALRVSMRAFRSSASAASVVGRCCSVALAASASAPGGKRAN